MLTRLHPMDFVPRLRIALLGAIAATVLLVVTGCGSSATRKALQQAEALADAKEYLKALDLLKTEIRQNPKEVKLQEAFILLLLRMGQVEQAHKEYATFARLNPKSSFPISALSHKDPLARKGVAQLLGIQKKEKASRPIARLLADPDVEVRRAAVAALGNLRAVDSAGALRKTLKDASWFVRADAADALAKIGDAGAVPDLLQALEDSEAYVRHAAGRAIQDLAQAAHQPQLIQALQSRNPTVRTTAAFALARLGDRRAILSLVACLDDNDWAVRRDAIISLTTLGDRSALPSIRRRLADPDIRIRAETIGAIQKFQDEEAVPELERMANNDREDRRLKLAAATVARDLLVARQKKINNRSSSTGYGVPTAPENP